MIYIWLNSSFQKKHQKVGVESAALYKILPGAETNETRRSESLERQGQPTDQQIGPDWTIRDFKLDLLWRRSILPIQIHLFRRFSALEGRTEVLFSAQYTSQFNASARHGDMMASLVVKLPEMQIANSFLASSVARSGRGFCQGTPLMADLPQKTLPTSSHQFPFIFLFVRAATVSARCHVNSWQGIAPFGPARSRAVRAIATTRATFFVVLENPLQRN